MVDRVTWYLRCWELVKCPMEVEREGEREGGRERESEMKKEK